MKYHRGDRIWWWSEQSGKRSKAVFLRYDHDRGKRKDCILVINIGPKRKPFKHAFRWPTKLTEPLVA
jgi:hypothetical protein